MKAAMTSTAAAPSGAGGFEPPSVPEIAKLFPQLEILDLIGHGGMGAVYKARQPSLDRVVALKILPARARNDAAFADRFTREARALAKLSHANIVAVYDFGQAGNLHYFVMEYVDGPNLRQLEATGKLTPREALKIIPQVCEALQFAHDEGIVHRDIKPENVLLDKKGRVKIADFGLAKLLDQRPQDFRLTGTKDVMGTPHYMAPEQVENPQAVDHRADIYSLGVVFYELLTGELPLGRFGPPSSRVQDVKIDVRLDEVVLRALEREPDRRYQQASQVKTDLENIAGSTAQKPSLGPQSPVTRTAERDGLRKEIRAPAIGLLATGILNWMLLPLVMALALPALARAGAVAGHVETETLTQIALVVLLAMPFVLCTLMIVAALKMMRYEAYGLAVGASVAAMVVTPGSLVGFPIGIWSLFVLTRREVRAAFRQTRTASASNAATAGRRAVGRALIWGGAAVVVLAGLLVVRSWRHGSPAQSAATTRVLKVASVADKPLSESLALSADGAWQTSCSNTQVFRLFEVPEPGVENCTVLYEAKLKTENLAGRAYLEMWCRFPGQGEFFSRGLDNTVSASTDWVNCQTPFVLRKGQKPDLIRLNLVVEGPGKVLIKDIRLEAALKGN
jgi:predicted Ser/Thr protein kinase